VCRVTELSNIFSNFSKIFFGAKKYFKQKVATQAKSQRGLKIIHRLVQSLWSLTQSYLVVYGGAWGAKSSAQDGFWADIALWTLWPTVHCTVGESLTVAWTEPFVQIYTNIFKILENIWSDFKNICSKLTRPELGKGVKVPSKVKDKQLLEVMKQYCKKVTTEV
jgi:hypothetical protein